MTSIDGGDVFGNHALKARLPVELTKDDAGNKVTFNLDRNGNAISPDGQNEQLLADNSYDSIYEKISMTSTPAAAKKADDRPPIKKTEKKNSLFKFTELMLKTYARKLA